MTMRIFCILGSPRKRGNTDKVLGWIEEALRRGGHQVDRADVIDHEVAGCSECWACARRVGELFCSIDDDAKGLFERMIAADAVLLATPLFFWGFPAQLKPLIDRMTCLVDGYGTDRHQSLLAGKRLALLVTAEEPFEDNGDLLLTTFERLVAYARCRPAGCLFVPHCTKPEQIGEEVRTQAAEFAGRLAAE
jgi:NAD(P)H-dependent FMN reductase